MTSLHNPRTPDHDVSPLFPDRWSPRGFLPDPVPRHFLMSVFEAARWSPSCYNEQPWLFLFAEQPKQRALFLSLLVEKNQLWARNAPVLIFALYRLSFAQTDKTNRHALFDLGAAWMACALQARALGLYAHAMAGFKKEDALNALSVPRETFDIAVAIALGRRADDPPLPTDLKELEHPNERKPLASIACEGTFPETVPL